MHSTMEDLVEEMLDLSILLTEATDEFEKIFIRKALERNDSHISKTAREIGIHRNTLSKRLSEFDA
ncbi:MAG: helix-turn-helix domain-containing protein [Pyrinomonadaceae bacterium]